MGSGFKELGPYGSGCKLSSGLGWAIPNALGYHVDSIYFLEIDQSAVHRIHAANFNVGTAPGDWQ